MRPMLPSHALLLPLSSKGLIPSLAGARSNVLNTAFAPWVKLLQIKWLGTQIDPILWSSWGNGHFPCPKKMGLSGALSATSPEKRSAQFVALVDRLADLRQWQCQLLPLLIPSAKLENPPFIDDFPHHQSHCHVLTAEGRMERPKAPRRTSPPFFLGGILLGGTAKPAESKGTKEQGSLTIVNSSETGITSTTDSDYWKS